LTSIELNRLKKRIDSLKNSLFITNNSNKKGNIDLRTYLIDVESFSKKWDQNLEDLQNQLSNKFSSLLSKFNIKDSLKNLSNSIMQAKPNNSKNQVTLGHPQEPSLFEQL